MMDEGTLSIDDHDTGEGTTSPHVSPESHAKTPVGRAPECHVGMTNLGQSCNNTQYRTTTLCTEYCIRNKLSLQEQTENEKKFEIYTPQLSKLLDGYPLRLGISGLQCMWMIQARMTMHG